MSMICAIVEILSTRTRERPAGLEVINISGSHIVVQFLIPLYAQQQ